MNKEEFVTKVQWTHYSLWLELANPNGRGWDGHKEKAQKLKCLGNCLGPGLSLTDNTCLSMASKETGRKPCSEHHHTTMRTVAHKFYPLFISLNRKLNPAFAKPQELSPARRQSRRWMHRITRLVSGLPLLHSIPTPAAWRCLCLPTDMGKSSRECGREVGVPNPIPSMGKASLT